jgi:UDP-galactopyranose mutase
VFADLRTRNPALRLLLIGETAGNVPHVDGMIRTGPIEFTQLPAYLASCDLFVLPLADSIANRGRWPGKINLYMAAGRPTIATPVGEVKRIFEELGGGVLARLENHDFVSQVESLLAHPDRMDQIGRVARRLAVERFDWRILATQLQGLYADVIAES